MSGLNIYDETENLISSDEYSEDEDELMNAAVCSQNNSKSGSVGFALTKLTAPRPQMKGGFRDIKLPTRKMLSIVYKKRSIKWLNNKQQREKCKLLLSSIRRKSSAAPVAYLEEKATVEVDPAETVPETICLNDADVETSSHQGPSPVLRTNHDDSMVLEITHAKTKQQNYQEKQKNSNETRAPCNKRVRSPSPSFESNCNERKKHEGEKVNNVSIYKELNDMFPKHDEVVGKHIKATNNTIEAIEENMTRLLLDIQTLNDILQTKENEWNKLLHLKKVKEEILTRLVRKKHIVEMKEKQTDDKKYGLRELKELELYLSNSNSSSTSTCAPSHQLIETRANMKAEDLEKELVNTNRLQSILVSSNILQRIDGTSNNINTAKNSVLSSRNHTLPTVRSEELQSYQYLEHKVKVANKGRQGPFKDVKSIIADFRQKNPEILPRVGKRIKMSDHDSDLRALNPTSYVTPAVDVSSLALETSYDTNNSNYTPTLEKLLSSSSRNSKPIHQQREAQYSQGFKFNVEGQKNYYRLHNDELCNEVSITPVAGSNRYLQRSRDSKGEPLRSTLDTSTQNNSYFDISEYAKAGYRDAGESALNEQEIQLCQECRTHEARFVCAGCGNQWYCSRSCQITAWDKHSEICSE